MQVDPSLEGAAWHAGLREQRLVVQRCAGCGALRHYPQPMCSHCQSMEVLPAALSGTGRVHSWTITHQTGLPLYRDRVPYATVTVDMAEGVRLLAPFVGTSFDMLEVGLAVRVVFDPAVGEGALPMFVPA